MKPIGAVLAPIAFGGKISPIAAEVMHYCRSEAGARMPSITSDEGQGADLLAKAQARILANIHLCESPIEEMMLVGLTHMVVDGTNCFPPVIHDVSSGEPWPTSPVIIAPQFIIARYRLDFLVAVRTSGKPVLLAIECDGKDFHSGRKEQARDAWRDDYLNALGISTMRYTGSWLYKNIRSLADEVAIELRYKRQAA